MIEKSRDVGGLSVFGLMVDGQMAKVTEPPGFMTGALAPVQPETLAESDANWQDWCSDMDEYGALVMLTASL